MIFWDYFSIFFFLGHSFFSSVWAFSKRHTRNLSAVSMLCFSILLASIGMVGFYVQVHRQVIDRPKFIVADTVGFNFYKQ